MRTSITQARKWLATVWLIGFSVTFFPLLLQTGFNFYGDKVNELWSWFLPTTVPTLSLIIGILFAGTNNDSLVSKTIDRFLFRLALILSITYLITVGVTYLLQWNSFRNSENPSLDLMKRSHLWLSPFQGFVSAAIGAFFVNKDQKVK
jgi:hypothetical protein